VAWLGAFAEAPPSFKSELQRGLPDRTAPTVAFNPRCLRVGFASALRQPPAHGVVPVPGHDSETCARVNERAVFAGRDGALAG